MLKDKPTDQMDVLILGMVREPTPHSAGNILGT